VKAADVLQAVAVGLDALDAGTADPAVSIGAKGAAVAVRALAALLDDRTPEEAVALLEQIRDHGARPITAAELDAQVEKALRP
jgi:hypothetical protein